MGNTDGRVGGKQYFHCPPKHGKVVKLSDVHAIMNPRVGISSTDLHTGKVSSRSLMSTGRGEGGGTIRVKPLVSDHLECSEEWSNVNGGSLPNVINKCMVTE